MRDKIYAHVDNQGGQSIYIIVDNLGERKIIYKNEVRVYYVTNTPIGRSV